MPPLLSFIGHAVVLFNKSWFYGALLALAAIINAAGYALSLWHEETLFDELVHLFTTFAGVAALGRALVARHLLQATPRVTPFLFATGLSLGLAWEAFEWLIGIIGGGRDTVMDLAMDALGALLAGLLISKASRQSEVAER